MTILPPGTILQLMFLKKRLKVLKKGKFLEIGPGSGEVTNLLLNLGWAGISFDIDQLTINNLRSRFGEYIKKNYYELANKDFLKIRHVSSQYDLVISCMVLEHLSVSEENKFIKVARKILKSNGVLILIVPSSEAHWGIEDRIAGHYRRYTREKLTKLLSKNKFQIKQLKGLTYPISNIMLPISNYLIRRYEKNKLKLSMNQRTKLSGRRDVFLKTTFPKFLGLLLNEFTLSPFFYIQSLFFNSSRCLVLYLEARIDDN